MDLVILFMKKNDIKISTLTEPSVERILRAHLNKKGWSLTNLPRNIGEHGCDITAWHQKWRKILLIEVKGGGKANNQMKHNGFYTLLGQILSRMSIEGNDKNRARIYAIAIPAEWEETFKRKILKMKYAWQMLKLKTFLVKVDETVEEKGYSYFLKQQNK